MKTEWQLTAPSFHIFYNDIIAENLSKSKEENQGHIRLALAMPTIEAKGITHCCLIWSMWWDMLGGLSRKNILTLGFLLIASMFSSSPLEG